MRKRKKFHAVRFPQKGAYKAGNRTSQTPAKPQTVTQNKVKTVRRSDADRPKLDSDALRVLRMHGFNVPDPPDEKIIENGRTTLEEIFVKNKLEDSLIILTDIETGFFRRCVDAAEGGGWYGRSNNLRLDEYGLSSNERITKEHIPEVEEWERENLLVRLIYRKAHHRATAHIAAFGKSVKMLVQECWFKCYLPWPCLERDIPRSVEVANNILQELEPEVKEQVKIVQPKIKAEMKLRKASGEYDGDAFFAPTGVPRWADLPPPETRGELNRLQLFYEEDRAANHRFKEKQDAHDKGKIGPKGSYSINDVYNREISLEDLQKRAAAKRR